MAESATHRERGHRVATFAASAVAPVRDRKTSSRSAVRTDSSSTSIGRVELVEQRRSESTPPSLALECQRLVVAVAAAEDAGAARSSSAASANSSRTLPPGTSRLSSAGVPWATIRPRSRMRDPVGEPVRLLEVLGRQQDRDAARDELADDVPHDPPAARVEARRRLVEEDDPRLADERHRQVEPPAHAARVGRDGLARRVDEVEPLEQLGDAAAALGPAEVAEVRDQAEVLLARELPVDGRDLAGDADRASGRRRARGDVVAADAPRRRRPGSASRGCGPSSSCRRRSARAGRTRSLRGRRGRCRRARPACRRTCGGRGPGSPTGSSVAVIAAPPARRAAAAARCRGPRPPAAPSVGDHVEELAAGSSRGAPRRTRRLRASIRRACCRS